MKVLGVVAAAILVALGIRSVLYWGRRPFEGRDVRDHVLFALYVTGRAGLWFAFAGLFGLFALAEIRGHAVIDLGSYRWYALVFLGLAILQLLAGWFLGRRDPSGTGERGK
jgi:hypothetical protein